MIALLVAGVLAQGADAVTMRFSHEANPIVLDLGPTAYLAKISLILGVTALVWALPRLRAGWSPTRRISRPMAILLASLLLVVGEVGAISNLLAYGSP